MTLKEQIKNNCQRKNISVSEMLRRANIQSGDFYQVMNGKKPFFPGWKQRIADALEIDVSEFKEV
jgi:predicted transcriptional regulator